MWVTYNRLKEEVAEINKELKKKGFKKHYEIRRMGGGAGYILEEFNSNGAQYSVADCPIENKAAMAYLNGLHRGLTETDQ